MANCIFFPLFYYLFEHIFKILLELTKRGFWLLVVETLGFGVARRRKFRLPASDWRRIVTSTRDWFSAIGDVNEAILSFAGDDVCGGPLNGIQNDELGGCVNAVFINGDGCGGVVVVVVVVVIDVVVVERRKHRRKRLN